VPPAARAAAADNAAPSDACAAAADNPTPPAACAAAADNPTPPPSRAAAADNAAPSAARAAAADNAGPTIRSRANPLLQRLRRLARDPVAYRTEGEIWIEGEHLCSALRQRRVRPLQAVVAESAWQRDAVRRLAAWAPLVVRVADAAFESSSSLASSAGIGYLVAVPRAGALAPGAASVVLDRVQDAGNVGSILRTAAAFGVQQVIALPGTAGLWSPKVLRAGMGAHFALRLHEGVDATDLAALTVPWVGTDLAATQALHEAALPWPCAWVFGHEGRGVDPALLARSPAARSR
jgi:TrmH family RNA methyltransferase